jgi:hypothetical protein
MGDLTAIEVRQNQMSRSFSIAELMAIARKYQKLQETYVLRTIIIVNNNLVPNGDCWDL